MQNNNSKALIDSQVRVNYQLEYAAMEAAYASMLEAMHEPEIIISANASEEQARLVNDINWVLNGCRHETEEPIVLRDTDGDTIKCETVLYYENRIYAERYDMAGDYWERQLLDTIVPEDLDKLYIQLIREIF